MTKTFVALAAAASIGAAAVAAPAPARADCIGCALFGGLVAGTFIGAALAGPRYYGPPPAYYGYAGYGYAGGPPAPGCHYTSRPVWDPYAAVYRPGPPVMVCP
jgi:hypothetical protein